MEENNEARPIAKKRGGIGKWILSAVIAILVVICLATCMKTVPTGYTGILTTFGRVEEANLEAGFHLKAPWQKIVLMDNRVQKVTVETQAFSSDIQQVDVRLTITYRIDNDAASKLYRQVGVQYYDKVISPRLMENTKSVFAKYSAEGLVEQRATLAEEVRTLMATDLLEYGVQVESIAIENIDFSDRFTDAIEAKQVATQELQRATTQQEQTNMEAKAAAERDRIAAQAKADVEKINADAEAYSIKTRAEAEADANDKIAKSLTEALIRYTEAQRWNGELPSTFLGSSDALPVINVDGNDGN